MKAIQIIASLALAIGLQVCPVLGKVIYVDDDATGANDGTSWADAYNYMQDALADAEGKASLPDAVPVEVRIAEGIYKPDGGAGTAPGDRKASFQLINGVSIKGGYAGYGRANPNAYDPWVYRSILTGDLKGDDGPGFVNCGDNSFHVVTAKNTDATAILDGVSIVSGNANGKASPDFAGGGLYAGTGSPTLANCTLLGNRADTGGGLHIDKGNPTLRNCMFKRNNAAGVGAGISIWEGKPILAGCKFIKNSATRTGGGAIFGGQGYPCPAKLVNCLFSGNSCGDWEGAGVFMGWANVELTNCTFADNSARGGGAICAHYSRPKLANCILWGDTASLGPEVAIGDQSVLDISYCCLEGSYGNIYNDATSSITWGLGNIDKDPKFRDGDGLDGVRGTEDDDLRVRIDSPCIDAGNSEAVPYDYDAADTDDDGDKAEQLPLDLDGRIRFLDEPSVADTGHGTGLNGGTPPVVDIGAYEYQRGVCGDVSHPYPSGDLDHDCRVGFRDLAVLAENWLACSEK
jgi:predicted outer membrane repeat protein